MTTIGSLFTGYGGLDLAVEQVTGGRTVWTSDIDPGACTIIGHRFTAPNLGDISDVDWATVEPVDIITGGFPCQDVSMAGRRAGMRAGTRSGLWSVMCRAIDQLRPQLAVIENVRGLLSADGHADVEPCPWCLGDAGGEPLLRALGGVLGDLADIGYDAGWKGLRAADVGAPHGRFRVFVIAWPAGDTSGVVGERGRGLREQPAGDTGQGGGSDRSVTQDTDCAARGEWRFAAPGQAPGGRARADVGRRDRVFTDADCAGSQGTQPAGRPDVLDGGVTADTQGDGRDERGAEPAGIVRRPDVAFGRHAVAYSGGDEPERRRGLLDMGSATDQDAGTGEERQRLRDATSDSGATLTQWGQFEPAIRRWERLTRPAPAPTERGPKGGDRLSPRFVEWMMGLPAGWVTDVPGLTRNQQLKALGNGVVPQQAAAALGDLLAVIP